MTLLDTQQSKATAPDALIWANANAGTGKTTVLTNRVLRLLLGGARPSRLLCLTYTKAAASEIQNRIIHRLRDWVTMDEAALAEELSALNDGARPTGTMLARARALFIEVTEQHEGLNIQTIHAFAQSLLRRFPVEAGVSPYFRIVDEYESGTLLAEAMQITLNQLVAGALPELEEAASDMLRNTSEISLAKLMQAALSDSLKWQRLVEHSAGADYLDTGLRTLLGLAEGETEESLRSAYIAAFADKSYREGMQALQQYCATLQKPQAYLVNALDAAERAVHGDYQHDVQAYLRAWLTKEHKPRSHLQKFSGDEKAKQFIDREIARALAYAEKLPGLHVYRQTMAFFALVQAAFESYRYLTQRAGVMDYQQLLTTAERLLSKESHMLGWVMYKLDGGLDHLLVDEAQDTSPEQWRMVKALVTEFFSGEGRAAEQERTVFIVGDEKQSIYSFQGADVDAFRHMREWLSTEADRSRKALEMVALETSYRSARKIIDAVNATAKMLGFTGTHRAREAAGEGRVVMLPLVEKLGNRSLAFLPPPARGRVGVGVGIGANGDIFAQSTPFDSPPDLPPFREEEFRQLYRAPDGEGVDVETIGADDENTDDVQTALGKKIAAMISGWFAEKKIIPSTARVIQPEDIMVLVRRRSSLVQTLSNELKRSGIAVQGVDRLILSESLAIQDLIAFGRWLTLPEDDYGLACILRSPLVGLSDEFLFDIAYDRKGTLWESLQSKSEDPQAKSVVELLAYYLSKVDYWDPHQIFYALLIKDKKICDMRARLGEDTESLCYEFLDQALKYQSAHTASMHGFIRHMEQQQIEIKRSHTLPDAVRIMTVHGAKGLEAPLVILADTANLRDPKEAVNWLKDEEGAWPLCLPSKSERRGSLAAFQERMDAERIAEYHRLLYVAMTRAKDELYVTGYRMSGSQYIRSWHAILSESLKDIAEFLDSWGEQPILDGDAAGDRCERKPIRVEALPEWLTAPMPPPEKAEYLMASRLYDADGETRDLLRDSYGNASRDFGIVMHQSIASLLTRTTGDVTDEHVEKLVEKTLGDMAAANRDKIRRQLHALITHPSTAFLFRQHERLVESAMRGQIIVRGVPQSVSAVIDLCVFTDETAWLVDFKTSDHVPQLVQDVPKEYIAQLAIYRHLLASVFPEKLIKTALVWTAKPYLQEIPEALLDAELLDVTAHAA